MILHVGFPFSSYCVWSVQGHYGVRNVKMKVVFYSGSFYLFSLQTFCDCCLRWHGQVLRWHGQVYRQLMTLMCTL